MARSPFEPTKTSLNPLRSAAVSPPGGAKRFAAAPSYQWIVTGGMVADGMRGCGRAGNRILQE